MGELYIKSKILVFYQDGKPKKVYSGNIIHEKLRNTTVRLINR